MREKILSFRKKCRLISIRLPLLLVVGMIVIMVCVIVTVYHRFNDRMIDEYERLAEGITSLMVRELDVDRIDEYIDKNFEMPEYRDILEHFYDLRDNYPDVLFLYVYRFDKEGGHVVFDLDSETGGAADAPGDIYELDEATLPYEKQLCAGESVPAMTGKTPDGYLLSYFRPVYDSQGKCMCYACVDFSMDKLHRENIRFVLSSLGILFVVITVVLWINISVMRKSITGPINKMSKCTKKFAYDTEEERFGNIQIMEELDIYTRDEIEDLHGMFVNVMKESMLYMMNLNWAKNDIKDKEEEIGQIRRKAYKDDLTGVGNKAAYTNEVEKLTQEIADGTARFAIVMVDINNLKYVNDTFGHERGDDYIRGCCAIVCDVYMHSPVFRVGGDEFAAILTKGDYTNRKRLSEEIAALFEITYEQENAQAWERYSASVGMAEFRAEDESVEQVFKRADEAMYAAKTEFKKKYGSYR
ncbi:MAG: GGDEF domain-containing protein [Lachnospiraceae bacterium]|jgi:diguanylate cyclase (GGDEF)-like protein|nr:GGDEF domain-containing protein [Lachnospiraceae bacterium]